MQRFPLSLWHSPFDGGDAARFSLGAAEEAPPRDEADPIESLRCDVIIALSNCLTTASISHPHLAPFLMDGLDNALECLLLSDHERDLRPIQQWLCQEKDESLQHDNENSEDVLSKFGTGVE